MIGLEEDASLARQATEVLASVGVSGARIVTGPLREGWAGEGPYDVILVEGSIEVVPPALFDQLKDGGRLVCMLGVGPGAKAMLYRRIEGELSGRPVFDAAAPPLPGFVKPPEFVF